ncbi:MAG: rRNA pseudouridine synthase [Actinobacteria bacterium]|nr:MAG: rRNA pseudouridine synthase [Actinomycetota bacterium]
MRLAKYLAHCGVASRRRAEELIASGKVSVGGRTVTDPAREVDESSGVEANRRPVTPEPREVWIVNKPAGVVSTAREPGRRQAVVELVDSERRLYPVGRLDADSTGLIVLTNDGELANVLTHPRYGVKRGYRVRLRRPASESQLRRLRRGVELEDGRTAPAGVRRVSPRVLEVTISEGRNRQVRRMIEAVGNEVVKLARIRYGSIDLGELPEGKARRLRRPEVQRLWKDARAVEKSR